MKQIGWIGAAVLSLTLGVAAPAFAQQDQHEQEKEHKEKPSPQKEKARQPAKHVDEHAKAAHEAEHKSATPAREMHPAHEAAHTVQQRTVEHKTVQETHVVHSGGHRIPDDRYRAHFGQEHRFHVSQSDYSRRRFQYGGYWFGFSGAWPSNWLYTEDVYVVDIDGVYYLCNPRYPGVNIAINVEE